MIGDLFLHGTPSPRMAAALAVIAAEMHPAFAADTSLKPDVSKRSCIMAALTVRDFLRGIGFEAEVAACLCYIDAHDFRGEVLHTLGIGCEDWKQGRIIKNDGWQGHLVVVSDGFLIDTTLYPARRPQWPDLPGMMALPLDPAPDFAFGMDAMAGGTMRDFETGNRVRIAWLAQPKNRWWRDAPDGRWARRRPVVGRMVEVFNEMARRGTDANDQSEREQAERGRDGAATGEAPQDQMAR